MSRYACVVDQKAAGFPVTTACEIAEVSTSGFYGWCQREAAPPTERELAEEPRPLPTTPAPTPRRAGCDVPVIRPIWGGGCCVAQT